MIAAEIIKSLYDLKDEKYREFMASLIPTEKNIIGVRLPQLRKLAKKIATGDWQTFLKTAEYIFHEEKMLAAMVIGYAKCSVEKKVELINSFADKIDNWAVCDCFAGGLKSVKNNEQHFLPLFKAFAVSPFEYKARFAAVMLLNYYINDRYIDEVIKIIDSVRCDGYYCKMAVAWCLSYCYIDFPDKTLDYLKGGSVDKFILNKTVDKIRESFRGSKTAKDEVLLLKK